MQPPHQPVIKFACAHLSPVWRAADAWRWTTSMTLRELIVRRKRVGTIVTYLGLAWFVVWMALSGAQPPGCSSRFLDLLCSSRATGIFCSSCAVRVAGVGSE